MAGTYKKQEFGVGAEEQTLLKDPNAARIVTKGSEPVRLSPGWEGTGRPDDELNFKGVTMDQADLELNPPRDRLNIVYFIMLLHGIGALMPWNMFITAEGYFQKYKLSANYTGDPNITYYGNMYVGSVSFAAQIPNLLFNWVNVFIPLSGSMTTRIVWGLTIQAVIFVFTVIMAMADTSGFPIAFFWMTMVSVVILNTANGIYQNSVFGLGAKLPGKYTGAIVLGSNISGTLTAVINILTQVITPNLRTAAIYYFIAALFIILACFDTYFALPINRFYRYHELLANKEKKKDASRKDRPPYLKIIRECSVQLFNIFFIFFVTLALFPAVHSGIKKSDADFIVPKDLYSPIMCFLTFNVTAMIGSLLAPIVKFPSKRFLIFPVVLRALFIPLFLFCNYHVGEDFSVRALPVLIQNDWVYLAIGITMGLSSGYLSSLGMMYCPTEVDPRHASTAGMFAAAALITGIFFGVLSSNVMPFIVNNITW
ncbi:equilibrative nucleoside transporter 1 [Diachasma alloeum]|uniref:equilibrative nucleoside transporter 1 n=1 Tax=Diachasma alloeum TaxID=454923 RepID=UPI0007381098|nr:equilibrative nucleoside transporter 1 [Diachasma alloeum]